jgi:hypothetical protein
MFTLRGAHMSAFSGAIEADFERRLADFLRQHVPGMEDSTVADIRPVVASQLEKARTYGLATEQELAVYVSVAALLGESFDVEFPAATQVLTSPVLPAAMKADWLSEWSEAILQELDAGGA